ncbi:hypothetical protein C9374_014447 [Naegleria lovaniensis]|uniref:Uncharacterized protein n=1 Tax=Naegleria lovaniensis TaxID=51637 RepID=A0AA88GUD0_NAELO|nr:uncharacterized protein C9374_014447 [Naegleria lovaniensis]KAG2389047.1 hypothetical protein C9374_014447 [Naegleria lovaniensis]
MNHSTNKRVYARGEQHHLPPQEQQSHTFRNGSDEDEQPPTTFEQVEYPIEDNTEDSRTQFEPPQDEHVFLHKLNEDTFEQDVIITTRKDMKDSTSSMTGPLNK